MDCAVSEFTSCGSEFVLLFAATVSTAVVAAAIDAHRCRTVSTAVVTRTVFEELPDSERGQRGVRGWRDEARDTRGASWRWYDGKRAQLTVIPARALPFMLTVCPCSADLTPPSLSLPLPVPPPPSPCGLPHLRHNHHRCHP